MKTKKQTGGARGRITTALLAGTALLTVLASCAKEAAEPAPQAGQPVQLIFPDTPPAWTAGDGTRTVDVGHGVTEWVEGDKIYVAFTFNTSGNKKAAYTYTSGAWKSSDIILWPTGETVDVRAWYIGGFEPGDEVVDTPFLLGTETDVPEGPVTIASFKHRTTRLEFKNVPAGQTVWLKGAGFYSSALVSEDTHLGLNASNEGVIEVASSTYYIGIEGEEASTCQFGLFDGGTTPDGSEADGWYSLKLVDAGTTTAYNGDWLTIDLASLGTDRPGDPSTGFVDAETQRFLAWDGRSNFTLRGDVDLSFCGDWVPFDLVTGVTFDGAGYTIRGLKVDMEGTFAGLFAANHGTIKNLTVEGTVVGHSDTQIINDAGGIAGINETRAAILNCRFRGTVQGKNSAGGIVGNNNGLVAGCSYTGPLVKATLYNAGGIVGSNDGLVAGCWSDAQAIAKGSDPEASAGGIAGRAGSGSSVYASYYTTDASWQGIGLDRNNGDAASDEGCTVFASGTYPAAADLNKGLEDARKAGAAIPAGMRWVDYPADHPKFGQEPFVYLP